MRPPKSPLFSIITVTFNAADTIGATLESVGDQKCDDYEHIIIDGASTDSTPDIVKREQNPRIIFHSEKDEGIYDDMDKGV